MTRGIEFSNLEWRITAYLVSTRGELHPHLPKQPDWCRTIGDDVWARLQRDEPISERDAERLQAAFLAAQLNRPDLELNPGVRSLCQRAVDLVFATEPNKSASIRKPKTE